LYAGHSELERRPPGWASADEEEEEEEEADGFAALLLSDEQAAALSVIVRMTGTSGNRGRERPRMTPSSAMSWREGATRFVQAVIRLPLPTLDNGRTTHVTSTV